MQDEKIPEELNITKEELYDEMLRIIEVIELDFYKEVDDGILPPDKSVKRSREGKGGPPPNPPIIDPRRLEFMKNQPNAITGFVGINSGFRGYYGFVFPKFLALENEKVGQGTFFHSFEEPISIDNSRFTLPPSQRVTQLEFDNIMQNKWKALADLTKTEFLRAGGERKIHPNVSDTEWEGKMQVEIDKRN